MSSVQGCSLLLRLLPAGCPQVGRRQGRPAQPRQGPGAQALHGDTQDEDTQPFHLQDQTQKVQKV